MRSWRDDRRGESMFILNDAPHGTERSYNGVLRPGALSKREGFEDTRCLTRQRSDER
jgi:hypothetical protein